MSISIPSAQEFFVENGLYKIYTYDNDTVDLVFQLLFVDQNIDCFCSQCQKQSTFKYLSIKSGYSQLSLGNVPKEFFKADRYGWNPDIDFNEAKTNSNSFKHAYICTRNHSHAIWFQTYIDLSDKTFQKIGQFPSNADINEPESKRFRPILGDFYNEYKKSTGLYSHGVGIGSYVYLRRIIENFIMKNAKEEASKSSDWNEELYAKSHFAEKVKILKSHLPDYFVENHKIYSILSAGIHELDENLCLETYPVIKSAIDLILAEFLSKKEEAKMKAEIANKIQQLNSTFKK